MGSKKVLKITKFGNILALRTGESLASLAKRQDAEFRKHLKKKKGR